MEATDFGRLIAYERRKLHQQYMIMMEAMLLVEKDRDFKRAVEKLEEALNMSVPGFDFAKLRLNALAEEEVVLAIALLREKMCIQSSSSGIIYL